MKAFSILSALVAAEVFFLHREFIGAYGVFPTGYRIADFTFSIPPIVIVIALFLNFGIIAVLRIRKASLFYEKLFIGFYGIFLVAYFVIFTLPSGEVPPLK